MQLIMSTDIDIGIKSMSSINQESLREKAAASNLVREIINELTNGNKENIEQQENVLAECEEKEIPIKSIKTELIDSNNDKSDLVEIKQEISEDITSDENSSEAKDDTDRDILTDDNSLEVKDTTEITNDIYANDNTEEDEVQQIEDDMEVEDNTVRVQNIDVDAAEDIKSLDSIADSEKTNELLQNEDEIEIIDDITSCENMDIGTAKEIDDRYSKTDLGDIDDGQVRGENMGNVTVSFQNTDTNASEEKDKLRLETDSQISDAVQSVEEEIDLDDDIIICHDVYTDAAKEIDSENDFEKSCSNPQKEDEIEIDDDIISCDNIEIDITKNESEIDLEVESEKACAVLENQDESQVDDDIVSCQNVDEGKDEQIENTDEDLILCDESPKQFETLDGDESKKELEESEEINENCSDISENKDTESVIIDIADEKSGEESLKSPPVELDNIVDLDNNNTQTCTNTESNEIVNITNNQDENSNSDSKFNLSEPECPTSQLQNNVENTLETNEKKIKEQRKFSLISKLSNTLDILSDEDEDLPKPEFPKEKEVPQALLLDPSVHEPPEKQCINIEDDDDIMLIDDEAIIKTETVTTDDEPENKFKPSENIQDHNIKNVKVEISEITGTVFDKEVSEPGFVQHITKTETVIKKEKVEEQKPLLPGSFLKTCKKNLADMTHEELEEFCIIKIVESVVDRSNLGEIKSQLKTLAQSIEEYKKKTMMLAKQNRDLQVVLKSVQEEQKKNIDAPVTPLKITRSVGMQVLMNEISRKKSVTNLSGPTNVNASPVAANRQTRTPSNQNRKSSPLQIPVPRLVPAGNAANVKTMSSPVHQNANATAKPVQWANSLPNGIKNVSTAPKAEKRPHDKLQQGNSVTVDLTDDEPPSKFLTRTVNPPVRCVPPQNLFPPRQAFSNPRKVYIPISGTSNQNIRPGQTIMLKSLPSQVNQIRPKATASKSMQNTNSIRMGRVAYKHPAPLPDAMKQYQPPNWKQLPPAPGLRLNKVENGIVISWKMLDFVEDIHEEVASYQLFAYQETSSPPSTSLWKKIGDVKALPLPMACTLTQFMAGYKYYFAVRAVDIRSRFGPFSLPENILLLNKV